MPSVASSNADCPHVICTSDVAPVSAKLGDTEHTAISRAGLEVVTMGPSKSRQ